MLVSCEGHATPFEINSTAFRTGRLPIAERWRYGLSATSSPVSFPLERCPGTDLRPAMLCGVGEPGSSIYDYRHKRH